MRHSDLKQKTAVNHELPALSKIVSEKNKNFLL